MKAIERQRFPTMVKTWDLVFERFLLGVLGSSDPNLAALGEQTIYEGDVIEVPKTSTIVMSDFRQISTSNEVNTDIVRETDIDSLVDVLTKSTLEIRAAREETFYSQLSDITERTGQVVNAKEEFTWEVWLEALEKVEHEFDNKGQWIPKTLVVNPVNLPTFERVFRDATQDPAKRTQFEALLAKKREEFYAKEANRKLVD